MTEIKALTVRQPWACAIATGVKLTENRVWKTDYRGLVAIHSSARIDRPQTTPQWSTACDVYSRAYGVTPESLTQQSTVLAVGRIDDCHPYEPGCCTSPWAEKAAGAWHWVLADVRPLSKPIRDVKGVLRLWIPDADLAAQIRAQLEVD